MSLEGKRFVVTGASGAIGSAVVHALLGAGAEVVATSRDPHGLRPLPPELGASRIVIADLTVFAAAAALARDCGSPVAGVIHTAGAYELAGLAEDAGDALRRMLASHVESTWNLAHVFRDELVRRQGDLVIVASSVKPGAGLGPYASAKAAQAALAQSLRAELNPAGVRVLCVYPGRTAGALQERLAAREGQPYRPERLLQPADVAQAILAALALPPTAEVTDLHLRPRHP
jgi:NADP-dependent 3-hydroxy acid dehydrogenase YdfG